VATQPSNISLDSVREDFERTGDGGRVLAARTAYVDELVCSAARGVLSALPAGFSLLAVGGYGRRQLFPYSDVDLLLLFENDRMPEMARDAIAPFLRELWDSGLRVSSSVRTPAECAELHDRNIELNISLLDQRFLTGDRSLYAKLLERLPRFIHGQRDSLSRNLSRLTRERHEKFNSTFYHLEPNIKETPGGFRDLQLIAWLDQIRKATPQRVSLADSLPELEEARRFLTYLRCHLHFQFGRDANQFTFDAQESIAGADAAAAMRSYFRHARDIYRLAIRSLEASEAQSSNLFAQFRDWRSRLSNADFSVSRERVHFRVPQQLEADPWLLLRLFQFIGRHGIRLSNEAGERIASRLPAIRQYFAESRPLWPALKELLAQPQAVVALRAMHDTGVLSALLPEFERIECLVIRDFYHRYTVDEHTLVTIQTLEELRGSTDPIKKRYADLLAELEDPSLLYFSLLMHDVGKGVPGGGHVDGSLVLAEAAMRRIQLPQANRETVLFLIRAHLEMSEVMQSRDIFDPATAQYLAQRVGTVERLKQLTLLTYADISSVNPAAMTPWRAEHLSQLYMLTYNELTRELETKRISTVEDYPEYAWFLDGFPQRYLLTHSASDIERHVRLEESGRKRGVSIELEKTGALYQLTMITHDRPFLFASVAGTLSGFGMNIVKAEAFANKQGVVLDTFTFSDPSHTLELNPSEIERLRATLERVVLGKQDVKELLRNRPKVAAPSRKSKIDARVSFDGDASSSATLIQIVAQDRPGLLYDLAAAISRQECNIEVVLIDTEAHKAIDVFYVTSDGGKIPPERQEALEQDLTAVCQ
jgi:[protein-PII] uridylyltransferase